MQITHDNDFVSQMLMILLGIVQILASLTGGILMDKASKRNFLLSGEMLMILCLFAVFFLEKYQSMVIVLIFLHNISYSFSIGPLFMYYAAKMLHNTTYAIFTNWLLTFLVALSTDFMITLLGIGKMCATFGFMLTICLVILFIGIPKDNLA